MDNEASSGISARTWNDTLGLLRGVFKREAPGADAFTGFLKEQRKRKEHTVHRKPFSEEEEKAILEAAALYAAANGALNRRLKAVLMRAGFVDAATAERIERKKEQPDTRAGLPEEIVRLVTGHSAVDVVRENYFAPKQDDMLRIFEKAMPGLLMQGGKTWEDRLRDVLGQMGPKDLRDHALAILDEKA